MATFTIHNDIVFRVRTFSPVCLRRVSLTSLSCVLYSKLCVLSAMYVSSCTCSYGLLGPNGCGKSLFMHVLGRRMLPIPDNVDTFHVVSGTYCHAWCAGFALSFYVARPG